MPMNNNLYYQRYVDTRCSKDMRKAYLRFNSYEFDNVLMVQLFEQVKLSSLDVQRTTISISVEHLDRYLQAVGLYRRTYHAKNIIK